jgi:hypothetical protein
MPSEPRGRLFDDGHQDLIEIIVRRGEHAYLLEGYYLFLLPVGLLLENEPAAVVKCERHEAFLGKMRVDGL